MATEHSSALQHIEQQHQQKIDSLLSEHSSTIQQMEQDHQQKIESLISEHTTAKQHIEQEFALFREETSKSQAALEQSYKQKLGDVDARHESEYTRIREEIESNAQKDIEAAWNELSEKHKQEIQALADKHAADTETLKSHHAQAMDALKQQLQVAQSESENFAAEAEVSLFTPSNMQSYTDMYTSHPETESWKQKADTIKHLKHCKPSWKLQSASIRRRWHHYKIKLKLSVSDPNAEMKR